MDTLTIIFNHDLRLNAVEHMGDSLILCQMYALNEWFFVVDVCSYSFAPHETAVKVKHLILP